METLLQTQSKLHLTRILTPSTKYKEQIFLTSVQILWKMQQNRSLKKINLEETQEAGFNNTLLMMILLAKDCPFLQHFITLVC